MKAKLFSIIIIAKNENDHFAGISQKDLHALIETHVKRSVILTAIYDGATTMEHSFPAEPPKEPHGGCRSNVDFTH